VVDRNRPLNIYRKVLLGSLLSAVVLLGSHLFSEHLSFAMQIFALYAASVITGTARAFSQPAIFASVPRIISREQLPKASAWMSTAMQVARIAGPAAGGIIFGFVGETASFLTISVLLVAGVVAMYMIKTQIEAPALTGEPRAMKVELAEGASFVFKHPILLPALSLDMISVLFGGVTALLPIFAKEILMVGPKGLGALRAAPAVGATLMSLFMTRVQIKQKAGPYLLTAVAGFGVCILVFAASKSFLLSLFALGLSGVFDSVSMIIRGTAVQLSSPDHMRGRISAVNSMFIGSSNELGEFESGVAAKLLGAVNATYFGGVMCLLTVAVIAVKSTALRKLDLEKL
jgi:predicted MFS family arabinose efflux permease